MKKVFRTILLIALIIAGVVAGYRGIGRSTVSMDSLLTFCTAQNGGTVAAWNDGNSTVIARLKQNGTINGHLKFRTERKDAMYQILGVTAGEKYVYVLRDKVDRYDGCLLYTSFSPRQNYYLYVRANSDNSFVSVRMVFSRFPTSHRKNW